MTVAINDGADSYVFTEIRRDVDFVEMHNLVDPANANAPFDLLERRKFVAQVKRPRGPADDGTNRNTRLVLRLERPILKEVPAGSGNTSGYTPPAAIDHRLVCNVEFILPEQSSDADIDQLRLMAFNMLAASAIVDVPKLRSVSGIT